MKESGKQGLHEGFYIKGGSELSGGLRRLQSVTY